MYFDRNATQSAAKRRGSGGMDRRSNAAWVSPQAVQEPGLVETLGGDASVQGNSGSGFRVGLAGGESVEVGEAEIAGAVGTECLLFLTLDHREC